MATNTHITRGKSFVWCLLAVWLLAGCGKKKLGANEYQAYLQDPRNGLRIEQNNGQMKTEFSLEPMEWQAFKASYANKAVDREKYDRYRQENAGLIQFSFKLYLPEKLPLYDYFATKYENPQEAMLYAEYDMKDDFKLTAADSDSIPAFAVHHQPSFGLKPYEEFLVLFKTADPDIEDKKIHIVYHDHLFGLHDMAFAFGGETMKNIPVLNIH